MAIKSILLVLFLNLSLFNAISHHQLGKTGVPERTNFKAYWNSPTQQCDSHLNFSTVLEKHNIIQNANGRFMGSVITLIYNPGLFPIIEKSGSLSNGGVPQQGNLSLHLTTFRDQVNKIIPDVNFKGLGIIDFESWRPLFNQNFDSLAPYQELSYEIERELHSTWSESLIKKEAERRFNYYGRQFMEETIIYAKQLRPGATWGYYIYPECYNHRLHLECLPSAQVDNDRMEWLFREKDTFNPSVYLSEFSLTPAERQGIIIGSVNEANRIKEKLKKPVDPLILPYFWYMYFDSDRLLSKEDVDASIQNFRRLNTDGVIIWGSSNDVKNKDRCEELYRYVDTVLGPALNA